MFGGMDGSSGTFQDTIHVMELSGFAYLKERDNFAIELQ